MVCIIWNKNNTIILFLRFEQGFCSSVPPPVYVPPLISPRVCNCLMGRLLHHTAVPSFLSPQLASLMWRSGNLWDLLQLYSCNQTYSAVGRTPSIPSLFLANRMKANNLLQGGCHPIILINQTKPIFCQSWVGAARHTEPRFRQKMYIISVWSSMWPSPPV